MSLKNQVMRLFSVSKGGDSARAVKPSKGQEKESAQDKIAITEASLNIARDTIRVVWSEIANLSSAYGPMSVVDISTVVRGYDEKVTRLAHYCISSGPDDLNSLQVESLLREVALLPRLVDSLRRDKMSAETDIGIIGSQFPRRVANLVEKARKFDVPSKLLLETGACHLVQVFFEEASADHVDPRHILDTLDVIDGKFREYEGLLEKEVQQMNSANEFDDWYE